MMKNFAIMTPFTLNWKYVVPYDFERLQYFVTPRVSILFDRITNGKRNFFLGSFLSDGNRDKFTNEYMPQLSKDRINMAFETDTISAFLTQDDAESCEALFKEEQFFCFRVTLLLDGAETDLRALPEEDYYKALEILSTELKVVTIMDLEAQEETLADMYRETREEVEKGMLNEARKKEETISDGEQSGKMATLKGVLGAVATTASVYCAATAKRMIRRGGKAGIAIGSVCSVLSFGFSVVGRSLMKTAINHFKKGKVGFIHV